MERAQRIAGLWSWLPAFRAVAETEHLPTAAAAMHVSPSALSRSVTLLEEAIGYPLFARERRRIRLNAAGIALLAAVRDAMRRVDDGLGAAGGPRPSRVRIASHPAWLGLLAVPLLAANALELEHVELASTDVRGALLRGTIDLAIAETIPPSEDILVERLGSVARGVCTAAGPRRKTPHGFGVCTAILDGWPAEVPRPVVLRSASLDAVIDACRAGVVRCVLPLALAKEHGLRRLRTPMLPPSQLYLARRLPVGDNPLEDVLVALRKAARVLV